ncbi:glycine-rich protein 1-like [Schistocerca piceifrons]|uniref:glycine-rich protein 1-like n=1 Tax=Schistocerca piceifrons TaxID=274613 RepID=UPI001F5FE9C3|nr:glycine-rich protein 1-like [Schistocerca piceifrons]
MTDSGMNAGCRVAVYVLKRLLKCGRPRSSGPHSTLGPQTAGGGSQLVAARGAAFARVPTRLAAAAAALPRSGTSDRGGGGGGGGATPSVADRRRGGPSGGGGAGPRRAGQSWLVGLARCTTRRAALARDDSGATLLPAGAEPTLWLPPLLLLLLLLAAAPASAAAARCGGGGGGPGAAAAAELGARARDASVVAEATLVSSGPVADDGRYNATLKVTAALKGDAASVRQLHLRVPLCAGGGGGRAPRRRSKFLVFGEPVGAGVGLRLVGDPVALNRRNRAAFVKAVKDAVCAADGE